MVLKKKLEHGFIGYGVPVIPRGPRSVRKTISPEKNIEDSQICAFELLAAVAGKLLQESESSASSNASEGQDPSGIHSGGIKYEHLEEGEALRSECPDQGSIVESVVASELAAQNGNLETTLREFPRGICDTLLEDNSIILRSELSKTSCHDLQLEIHGNKAAVEKSPGKVEGGSRNWGESCDGYIDGEISRQIEAEGNQNHNIDLTVANTSSSKDPMEICVNNLPLVNSDSSVQLPSYRNSVPNASFPRYRNNVKVGSRDDDENSVGRNRSNSKIRAFRPQPRIGLLRIRKLLTNKYWKVAPTLKDCELYNNDGHIKPVYCSRKALYTSERIQRQGPFKKRKLCERTSTLAHDAEGSCESISNSPEKGTKAANMVSSSVVGHHASFLSKDSHVKFSIKSLTVPEFYIDVPETATVGLLKRTVMEAVTAIFQGGLHVGVIVHGKKVKDDNKTLLQTGVSHDNNLDTLGFMLEPAFTIASPPISPKDLPILQPCKTHQQLTRSPASPVFDSEVLNASFDPAPVTNVDNHVETNRELIPSPRDVPTDGTPLASRALVGVPAMSVEALSVVPGNQKTRRSELVQRRTRRPFSVSEVEALVEAVEKLGTGRWRDVKLRSFVNADHRTYVDLKDKWKTLVHTATISPQQRRGLPVPQYLLDRVLSAHSYWSQRQPKLHSKHQNEPLMISEVQGGEEFERGT